MFASEILTSTEEQFAVQLYALMSDTGVHPLMAEPEYVRLMNFHGYAEAALS